MNWCAKEANCRRIYSGDFGYGKLPGGKYAKIVLKQAFGLKSCISDDTHCESEYVGKKCYSNVVAVVKVICAFGKVGMTKRPKKCCHFSKQC